MNTKILFSTYRFAKLLILTLIIVMSYNVAYAKSGCCSGHGGVLKCDLVRGYQICKDNSLAKNCSCKKEAAHTGCCSGHGGVDKCDVKTGFLLCKDKTHSNCACK